MLSVYLPHLLVVTVCLSATALIYYRLNRKIIALKSQTAIGATDHSTTVTALNTPAHLVPKAMADINIPALGHPGAAAVVLKSLPILREEYCYQIELTGVDTDEPALIARVQPAAAMRLNENQIPAALAEVQIELAGLAIPPIYTSSARRLKPKTWASYRKNLQYSNHRSSQLDQTQLEALTKYLGPAVHQQITRGLAVDGLSLTRPLVRPGRVVTTIIPAAGIDL